MLGFQWLVQVQQFNCLQDYRRSFSSFKANEEWPHIATVHFYNESELKLFYRKRLIVCRGQAESFVKFLETVLVYKHFYKNKP